MCFPEKSVDCVFVNLCGPASTSANHEEFDTGAEVITSFNEEARNQTCVIPLDLWAFSVGACLGFLSSFVTSISGILLFLIDSSYDG